MPKENDTNENEIQETENVEEIQEAEGLSLRDALEVAIEADKEPEGDDKTESVEEVKEESKLQPPAEWEKEDKELFYKSSLEHQQAALKLHEKRNKTALEIRAEKENIAREKADLQYVKDIEAELTPYLKSVGEKRPTREAILNAIKMRNEFENGDPRLAAAAYLQAKGIPVPSDLLAQQENNLEDPKIKPLQDRINALEMDKAEQVKFQAAAVMSDAWDKAFNQRNAAGTLRFPDVDNTKEGIDKAGNIGSLVTGRHPDSSAFIGYVKARIPDALTNPVRLLQEGYFWFNGRVDDSEAPRTQDTQKHIARSSRAASSVPGRAASTASFAPAKKLGRREALASAIAEVRERDGA